MTVENEVRARNYAGDGVTTVWIYDFKIPTANDVEVRFYDTVTEVWTTLTSEQYSITGVGEEAGGTITYPLEGDPLPSTSRIYITRVVAYTQALDIPQTGNFDSSTLEEQLDDTTYQIQQVRDDAAGGIKLPDGETFETLPPKSTLLEKYIYIDSDGNPVGHSGTGGGGDPLVTSVNGQTGAVVLNTSDISEDGDNLYTSAAEVSKLAGIETGAEVNPTDSEIKAAYDNETPTPSAGEISGGTETEVRKWSPANVKAMVDAHATGADSYARVFKMIDYIRTQSAVSAQAIIDGDRGAQVTTSNSIGMQNCLDAAVLFLRDECERFDGVLVELPPGPIKVNRSILSDTTAAQVWNPTTNNLEKKRLAIFGDAKNVTLFELDGWPQAVRNVNTSGNYSFGPWDGEPGPDAFLNFFCGGHTGNPMLLSLRDFICDGEENENTDPIGMIHTKALNAEYENIIIRGFAQGGLLKSGGDYNSFVRGVEIENCGTIMKSLGGSAAVGSTGQLPEVLLDFTQLTSTTGQVAVADGTTTYFNTNQIGKNFWIQDTATVGTGTTTGKWTITGIPNAQTANITLQGTGATARPSINDVYGSFECITGDVTASSTTLTLEDPIRIGNNADSMIGRLICIPKAGSLQSDIYTGTGSGPLDMLVTRIVGVGGAEGAGYTTITMAEPAKYTASDCQVVVSSATMLVREETHIADAIANGYLMFGYNDMDWLHYRSEGTGRQLVAQNITGANQWTGVKFHGAGATIPNFAAEGNIIFDSIRGIDFLGCNFTYNHYNKDTQVYGMGPNMQFTWVGGGFLSTKCPADQLAIKYEPTSTPVAGRTYMEIVTRPSVTWNNNAFPVSGTGQGWITSTASNSFRLYFAEDASGNTYYESGGTHVWKTPDGRMEMSTYLVLTYNTVNDLRDTWTFPESFDRLAGTAPTVTMINDASSTTPNTYDVRVGQYLGQGVGQITFLANKDTGASNFGVADEVHVRVGISGYYL